jgi:hypothetical protein
VWKKSGQAAGNYRQLLEDGVVDDLVVAALHEGAVDRAEGLEALNRHAGRKSHGLVVGFRV